MVKENNGNLTFEIVQTMNKFTICRLSKSSPGMAMRTNEKQWHNKKKVRLSHNAETVARLANILNCAVNAEIQR